MLTFNALVSRILEGCGDFCAGGKSTRTSTTNFDNSSRPPSRGIARRV